MKPTEVKNYKEIQDREWVRTRLLRFGKMFSIIDRCSDAIEADKHKLFDELTDNLTYRLEGKIK